MQDYGIITKRHALKLCRFYFVGDVFNELGKLEFNYCNKTPQTQ